MLFDTIAGLREYAEQAATLLDALSVSAELKKLHGPIDIKISRADDNPASVVAAHLATATGIKLFAHMRDDKLLFVQFCDDCQQRYTEDALRWKCQACATGEHRRMFDDLFALWRQLAHG